MDKPPYTFPPHCERPDCPGAKYKIGAEWSYGSHNELKNYGLACDACLPERIETARRQHALVKPAEDEGIGPLAVYGLVVNTRDRDLPRVDVPGL
jgi:hypothetical protein